MVKAPRSKGCRVCVDRRVKCDQRRPFCLRCEKVNRQCPGYETINIVDEGPSVRQLYQNVGRDAQPGSPNFGQSIAEAALRRSPMSSMSSASSRTKTRDQFPFEYPTTYAGSRKSASPPQNAEDREPDLERSTLVAIISPTAYQVQLFSSFINSIAYGNTGSIAPAQQCHSVWMSDIATRPEISSTLLWAIRAISLSYLGLQMQDRNLIHNSRNMYGRALLKLNKSLQDPIEGLTSDTLSATVLLSFYELMICTDRNSWIRHAGGAGNLMRLRGPDRHRQGLGRSVFLSCRFTLVLEAYHTREPCFLALPEWKQLSRDLHQIPEFQTPSILAREDIYQELVECPGYVNLAVNYMLKGSRDIANLRDLVSRGREHRSNYKHLHTHFVETLREAGHEPPMTASPSGDQLFPVIYQHPSILVASCYCSFWTLTIMLNIILIGLEARVCELSNPNLPELGPPSIDTSAQPSGQTLRGLPLLWMLTERTRRTTSPSLETGASPSDFPSLNEDDTAHRRQIYMAENITYAREICKSVESFSLSVFLGPLFLIYALRTAVRVLNGEEARWIMGKLANIGKVFGIAKAEFEIYVQHDMQS